MDKLNIERERAAVAALRSQLPPEEFEIAIEGETNLLEAITACLAEIDEAEMMITGIESRTTELNERRGRLEARVKSLRAAIMRALEETGLPSIKLPTCTISVKQAARQLQIVDEAKIPFDYWRPQPPKLDRKAILEALKAGTEIAGASLDNGGQSLQVRKS